jgi:hypothetical protein
MSDAALTGPDELAALVAINVRNALERFHAADEDDRIAGLDDAAMSKINPAIRRAVHEVFVSLNAANAGDPDAARRLAFLAQMVPSYWEPASALPESGVL